MRVFTWNVLLVRILEKRDTLQVHTSKYLPRTWQTHSACCEIERCTSWFGFACWFSGSVEDRKQMQKQMVDAPRKNWSVEQLQLLL